MTRQVDHSALRTNQAFIIGGLLFAFILNIPTVVGFVAIVLTVGTIFPQAALFKRVYNHVLQPTGLVKEDVKHDNPEPHRFSQGLGGIFTLLSTILLFANLPTLGWVAAWLVIALASLNLFAGFCAGCFLYYQLSQRNVPGFTVKPLHQVADQVVQS